jgi:transposase
MHLRSHRMEWIYFHKSLDDLVPENQLLRKVDKYIDFSFIGEKVRPFYSENNGRPSDPIMLFKMMFIGYFYGIRSERQLDVKYRLTLLIGGF